MRMLVIAPHADDEVLGCGGTLAAASAAGAEIDLVVMATGGVHHRHLAEPASVADRMVELERSCAILGVKDHRVLFPGQDMRLEAVQMLELVSVLDAIFRAKAYDEVLLPEVDHNRDHLLTHEAAVAALRLSERRPPEIVAAYEIAPGGLNDGAPIGAPMYVDITGTIDRKLAALHAYASQVRSFPHPVSEEAVRRRSAMRGLECGRDLAERHRLLRWIRG